MFRNKQRSELKQYKKSADAEESRRKREEITVELRKSKRDEQLSTKRRMNAPQTAEAAQTAAQKLVALQEAQSTLANLQYFVNMLNSEERKSQYEAAVAFRKLLSIEDNPPIKEVIDAGIVPRLISLLQFNEPTLQFECAWSLTNIASGSSDQTQTVVRCGGVTAFTGLLHRSLSVDVREQAVWALGNIAGDSVAFRDMVLGSGALPMILAQCTPDAKNSMLRNVTWAISNLCRGTPPPPFDHVKQSLPVLFQLLQVADEEVLADACWALTYLSDDRGTQNLKIQAVLESGVLRHAINLMLHKSYQVKTPALRTIGNLVTGNDSQTQTVINHQALPALLSLLKNARKNIRKEACWAISNIAAGDHMQVTSLIQAGIFPALVDILDKDTWECKKEAAWAISNATSGGKDEHIRYLGEVGVVGPLCALLTYPDSKVQMMVMEGIDNILRVGKRDVEAGRSQENKFADDVELNKGLEALEELQMHDMAEIARKALKILTNYFPEEEEEPGADAELAPATSAGGATFTFGPAPPPAGGAGGMTDGGFQF